MEAVSKALMEAPQEAANKAIANDGVLLGIRLGGKVPQGFQVTKTSGLLKTYSAKNYKGFDLVELHASPLYVGGGYVVTYISTYKSFQSTSERADAYRATNSHLTEKFKVEPDYSKRWWFYTPDVWMKKRTSGYHGGRDLAKTRGISEHLYCVNVIQFKRALARHSEVRKMNGDYILFYEFTSIYSEQARKYRESQQKISI